MFDGIFDAIEEWMRELLTGVINTNLDRMFTDVNQKTGEIAGQVGMTPENWNSSIFQMIHNLSDSVIVPIAGMIITFVLCYELISMVTEKNNMHDIDTWMFFKYFFKMWVAVYLVSHTFDITMAVFDLAQYAVNQASGVIAGSTALDIHSVITGIDEKLEVILARTFSGIWKTTIGGKNVNRRIKKYLDEIDKTERKITELQAYLKGIRSALKQEEDNEIIKSIRSKKYSSQELLKILTGIQDGTIGLDKNGDIQRSMKRRLWKMNGSQMKYIIMIQKSMYLKEQIAKVCKR